MRPRSVVLAVAALALTAASCSTSKAAPASARGPVEVLYAGSLVTLMEKTVGPAFQSATGYTFSGVSGDSGALANEIKGRTVQGDVFISANPSKDQLLEGAANGNRITWYAAFICRATLDIDVYESEQQLELGVQAGTRSVRASSVKQKRTPGPTPARSTP